MIRALLEKFMPFLLRRYSRFRLRRSAVLQSMGEQNALHFLNSFRVPWSGMPGADDILRRHAVDVGALVLHHAIPRFLERRIAIYGDDRVSGDPRSDGKAGQILNEPIVRFSLQKEGFPRLFIVVGLEIDLHPKTQHERGVSVFSRWRDNLQIRRKVQPRRDRDVVINFAALLVVEPQTIA